MSNLDRIVIGTASWRQSYGTIIPDTGLSKKNIYNILDRLLELGINKLDTADSYGDVLEVLASYENLDRFHIVTKFHYDQYNYLNSRDSVLKQYEHLENSATTSFMIHNPNCCYINMNEFVEEVTKQFSSKPTHTKFGVSIYTPDELDDCMSSVFDPQMIQLPFCFGDDRWSQSLGQEKTRYGHKLDNLDFYARSIFLQGTLLERKLTNVTDNLKLRKTLKNWWAFIDKESIDPYQLCLAAVVKADFLNYIIVGCKSIDEINTLAKIILSVELDEYINILQSSFTFERDILDIRTWNLN
ncbi:aldo/keto reductase [Lentibacter algarum]|uniref:aldo/keto reductase n=1 Tax=Lentibacter algarum TaxID=576131 RepID=UPI00339D870A